MSESEKPVKRKCTTCGGEVRKHYWSQLWKKKKANPGFWYECIGCGLPMKDCICKPIGSSRANILDEVFGKKGDKENE